MHRARDGYETRQVFLFHVFGCIFDLNNERNTTFFGKITNQIFGLNCARVICEPVRSENKRLCTLRVNSTSIATLHLLLLLKVLRFHNQSFDLLWKDFL